MSVFEERIAALKKEIGLRPNAGLYNELGLIYTRLGKSGEADHCFRKAIEYAPVVPLYWYNYGVELIGQKRYREALEKFNKAIALLPGYEEAIDKRDYLLENFPL